METAQWNTKRDAFERSEAIGHADGMAALIYCVLMLDEHTNPMPSSFGLSAHNTFIPGRTDSQAAQTLKQIFNRR